MVGTYECLRFWYKSNFMLRYTWLVQNVSVWMKSTCVFVQSVGQSDGQSVGQFVSQSVGRSVANKLMFRCENMCVCSSERICWYVCVSVCLVHMYLCLVV